VTLPSNVANGTHTIYAIGDLGDLTGRQITVNVTRVNSTAIANTTGCTGGYIKRSGTYYVYADIAGTPSSVTANVGTITSGQTAVPLTPGNYVVGGEIYNYRSAQLTAGATVATGNISYTVTPAGSTPTSGSTVVDATLPTPVDVQTVNKGATAGTPEAADAVIFTYSEPIEPCTLIPGWDGDGTEPVVTYFDDGGTRDDSLTFYYQGTWQQVPLGSVNLGATRGNYASSDAIFGYGSTSGTIAINSYQVTVTLGSLYSGTVTTASGADVMRWTGGATPAPPTDFAGNNATTGTVNESGVSDKEF
jgi:hypothetical protein